jgi:hypothetical protein
MVKTGSAPIYKKCAFVTMVLWVGSLGKEEFAGAKSEGLGSKDAARNSSLSGRPL